ncbi:PEBP-like protein [Rhodotorula sp. JG-1b]|nr:PEBP-like protein [Rhodotorula sp. JG-1b]
MHRSRLALRTCQRALSSSTPGRAAAASTSTSTSYQPPVKAGSLPAYDAALEYIQQDRENKLKQLEQLKQSGAAQDKLDKLEVEAWSNDPETRWRAKTGAGDMSKPVYRQLAERKWRKEGDLAILMQRVTQMHVTPDLLAEINPQADVRIQVAGETIEPGVFTAPARTREGFEVTAQVFHPEERLYTLLLVDPDVPDEMDQTFTTYAHWLVPNIPLSATSTTLPLDSLPASLAYVPPHPQNGTPYHRYTTLLLEQSSQLELSSEPERLGFSVREFVDQYGLSPAGVSFFRQKWDKDVSAIYSEVLGEYVPEPKYGRPPKIDTYANRPAKYEVV